MRSYILLPTEHGLNEEFAFVHVIDWNKQQDTLRDLNNKFKDTKTFALWSVFNEPSENVNPHINPSTLSKSSSICHGLITTANNTIVFIPMEDCEESIKEQMKQVRIPIRPARNNDFLHASDYQDLLMRSVAATINEICSSNELYQPVNNHWVVAGKVPVYILLDNGTSSSKETIWQRLHELNLSSDITEANVFYLSRQPNNAGLQLQCISLCLRERLRVHDKSDAVAKKIDVEYLQSALQDAFRSGQSDQDRRSAISSIYDIKEEGINFDYSNDRNLLCTTILDMVVRDHHWQEKTKSVPAQTSSTQRPVTAAPITSNQPSAAPENSGSAKKLFGIFPKDLKLVILNKLDLSALARLSVVNPTLTSLGWERRYRDHFPYLYQNVKQKGVQNWRVEFVDADKNACDRMKDQDVMQKLFSAIGDKSVSLLEKVINDKYFNVNMLFRQNNYGVSPFVCAVMNGFNDAFNLLVTHTAHEKFAPIIQFLVAIATRRPIDDLFAIIYNYLHIQDHRLSRFIAPTCSKNPIEGLDSYPTAFEIAVLSGNHEAAQLIFTMYSENQNAERSNLLINQLFLKELYVSSDINTIEYFINHVSKFTPENLFEGWGSIGRELGEPWHMSRDGAYEGQVLDNAIRYRCLDIFRRYKDLLPVEFPEYLFYQLTKLNIDIIPIINSEQSAFNNFYGSLIRCLTSMFKSNELEETFAYQISRDLYGHEDFARYLSFDGPWKVIDSIRLYANKYRSLLNKYDKKIIEMLVTALHSAKEGEVTRKQVDDIKNYLVANESKFIRYHSYSHPNRLWHSLEFLLNINNQPTFKKAWGNQRLKESIDPKDKEAQFKSAQVYEYGLEDRSINLKTAFDLYRRAARNGHDQAAAAVSRIYEQEGKHDLAAKWIAIAMEIQTKNRESESQVVDSEANKTIIRKP